MPWTIYACTKLFGEALARYYSDHHGMAMICIRLCWFQGYDSPLLRAPDALVKEWCSPRDFVQLLKRAIESDVRFGIFFGVSNNTGRYWDISNAQQLLGYAPEDDAAKFRASHGLPRSQKRSFGKSRIAGPPEELSACFV